MSPSDVVASAVSERGEVVLRRRDYDGALELRVNGVFVMDDRETSTETLLASTTLEALRGGTSSEPSWRVVIGGLGLGYTLRAVLADEGVSSVLVVEIEEALVNWHRDGLVAGAPAPDPRLEIVTGDVREVVSALPNGTVDLVLLDVDNGPDFLVYESNAAIYESPFLASGRDVLRPGGLLAVWSAATSPALTQALDAVFGSSRELALPVILQGRQPTYHLFLARR